MPGIGKPYLQFDSDSSQFLTFSVLSPEEWHQDKGTPHTFFVSFRRGLEVWGTTSSLLHSDHLE